MNDAQEDKVSMYYKVRTFFVPHLVTLSTNAPYLTTAVGNFNGSLDQVQAFWTEFKENTSGYTDQKKDYKVAMRNATLIISGALQGYYLSIGNKPLANKYKLTKSDIDGARDAIALYECDRVLAQGQAMSVEIEPFGGTAAALTNQQTSNNNFRTVLKSPAHERGESKASGEKFVKQMKETDDILEIIDVTMQTQMEDHELLYLQYLNARAIDNSGGGSGEDPDFVFVVEPGAFYTATTIPYSETRSFEAKNVGAQNLNWGLSSMETSFSNPPNVLNADSVSTKNSVTLGGSGDFLIFENTSGEAVGVELRVID